MYASNQAFMVVVWHIPHVIRNSANIIKHCHEDPKIKRSHCVHIMDHLSLKKQCEKTTCLAVMTRLIPMEEAHKYVPLFKKSMKTALRTAKQNTRDSKTLFVKCIVFIYQERLVYPFMRTTCRVISRIGTERNKTLARIKSHIWLVLTNNLLIMLRFKKSECAYD